MPTPNFTQLPTETHFLPYGEVKALLGAILNSTPESELLDEFAGWELSLSVDDVPDESLSLTENIIPVAAELRRPTLEAITLLPAFEETLKNLDQSYSVNNTIPLMDAVWLLGLCEKALGAKQNSSNAFALLTFNTCRLVFGALESS